MPESPTRARFRERLCANANQDERIAGLLIGGSGSDERLDEFSDIDAMYFIRDADFESFVENWQSWAAQFGEHVLIYDPIGFPNAFWTIYHAEPYPQRVEFGFRPESEMDMLLSLQVSPSSVEAMVCCDKTGGRLTGYVQQLVGRSTDLPEDEKQAAFKDKCDQFWYILLYSFNKMQRGHQWYARVAFHIGGLDSLMALLKLESGNVHRWRASFASWNLENMISPERLAQLNECIPGEGKDALRQAMVKAALLGLEVCQSLAGRYGWPWPERAAEDVLRALTYEG